MCMRAVPTQHFSEAPSGLDNTSPFASIRLSLLTLSFTLERGSEKRGGGLRGGAAVEITGCCLRRGSEEREKRGGQPGVREGGRETRGGDGGG